MNVDEACRTIESAEEFTFDQGSLECLESVALSSDLETKALVKALAMAFWRLPKLQNQEKWVSFVIEKIDKRSDNQMVFMCLLEHLKSIWLSIDIRRIEKFVMLLEHLMAYITAHYETPLKEFIVKGPTAAYDLVVMRQVVRSRECLSDDEVKYLVEYLTAHADTYFVKFFSLEVLPKLQKRRVSHEIAETSYTLGNQDAFSAQMREVFYAIYVCDETKA